MAWSRDRVDSSNINNGNEYQKGDRVSRQQLNAMVNAGLYSQDFVEALTETPVVNNEEVNANPTVNLIPYEKNGKEFYKFEFNNIKGKTGETGPAGADGRDGTNGLDGQSANISGATAELSSEAVNTPVVNVQLGGTPTDRTFHFVFKGILGGSVDVSNKAEVDASNLSDDNVTAWKEKLNIGSGLPIGFIIASTCKQNDAGLHLADGSELMIGGTYDAFCQYVINNQANFPITDLATYQTELNTVGQCGKYVITDTYVRLPKITKGIESANTENEFGTSLGAGLPNITASQKIVGGGSYGLYLTDNGTEGAFGRANSVSGQLTGGSGGTTYQTLTFDASAGETKLDGTFRNDVYGKSDTVQSQVTKYYFYIVVGTVTKTDLLVDIDNITNDVNNKADKSGANIDAFTWAGLLAGETTGWLPQIKQISNVGSYSGYVQYGNVLMQWGRATSLGGSSTSKTITLHKPYASDSSYSVVSYANSGPANDYMNAQRVTSLTATSFKIQTYYSETGMTAFWFTIGFAPEEAE